MNETRFILAGNLIDGSGAEVRRNVFLAVQDGTITAIGRAADLPRNSGPMDDFSYGTIVPALVDCSVSLSRSPSVDKRVRSAADEAGQAEKAALVERHIGYCHAHGVLGVADSGDRTGVVQRYREKTGQEGLIDIRTSIDPRQIGQDKGGGADFLRICYSRNIEEDGTPSPGFSREDLCRLLHRRDGKKTVVVANGRERVAEALAAGCGAIEQGYGMGEANLRAMAEMGVLWFPGLLRSKNAHDGACGGGDVACRFSQRYAAPGKADPSAEAFWKKMLAEQLGLLGAARKLGVTTAIGTGAGSVGILHGESMVEEMKLFIRAGYTLEEAIRSASANGARFFGMDRLGALTVGRRATFLVARGMIRQLPRKLSYLETIFVNGAQSSAYRKNPVRTA